MCIELQTCNILLLLIASPTTFLFPFISLTLFLILSLSSDFKLVRDTLPCFLYSSFSYKQEFFLSQKSLKVSQRHRNPTTSEASFEEATKDYVKYE